EKQVEEAAEVAGKRIIFLGFFREASSILHEFELKSPVNGRNSILDDLLIIDFNPVVHSELRKRSIECVYGDIAHLETLHHADIHDAELVVSTIPDFI